MKLNRQQITELFGSAPEDQDGKKLVGIEYKSPLKGETFHYNGVWCVGHNDYSGTRHQVAIFEATHREDGTPMDIDPLPVSATPHCVRVVYSGPVGPDYPDSRISHWCEVRGKWLQPYVTGKARTDHNAIYIAIDKPTMKFGGVTHRVDHPPTTLEDLVGEDGQKNFYLWCPKWHEPTAGRVQLNKGKLEFLLFNSNRKVGVEFMIEKGVLWSSSPFTPYSDATKFVVEGGSNE